MRQVGSTTYTTSYGDMWDALSYKAYGSERLATRLIQANPEHADVVVFDAGVVLTIPIYDETATSLDVAPWRR